MSAVWTDDRIEAALGGLADALAVPEPAAVPTAIERRRRPGTPRVLLTAAALVVVIAVALAAVPSTRRAMADWLGLGNLEVRFVGDATADPTGLPRVVDDLEPIPVAEALAVIGLEGADLIDLALGEPAFAGRPPEGGVLLAWDRDTTLWIRPGEHPAADAPVLVTKQLGIDARAERVDGLGDGAVFVDGPHVLATPSRRVAADRILWWLDDGTEYRLESDRPRDELVAIGTALASRSATS